VCAHVNEDRFPRTHCRSCAKTVEIAGTVFVRYTPFGEPSNIALCQTCVVLPRVSCTKCQRILRVGDGNVAVSSNYADGAVILCETCNPTIAHRCRACSTPAAHTNANGDVVPLPGASFIHQAGDENAIVGWRCSICTIDPLRNTGEAQDAYNAAVVWMTNWLRGAGLATRRTASGSCGRSTATPHSQ